MPNARTSFDATLRSEQRKLERICAWVFVIGGVLTAIASIVDSQSGLFTAWDNYGTAITSPVYVVSGLLMFWRPQWLFGAVLLSMIPSAIYQQGVMAMAVHVPGAASLYSAMSSGPYLPLFYVATFISLPRGAATFCWAHCAGYYVQFLLNHTLWADPNPAPERQQAEHLLIEVMASHPVYIIALNYIVTLRERLYATRQELFQNKESLLSMVSHEIRNQLQTMLGAIEILGLRSKSAEEQRAVTRLDKAATQLQTYLADMNELTRLEDPAFRVDKQRFDLQQLLRDVHDEWHAIAEQRRLTLQLDAPPLEVVSDEARVRQIVSNLVSNALKYTPTGTIALSAHRDETGVVITVTDTGIGIDSQHLARIFEPRVRLENARAYCDEGSGLGLTIARRLATSLGGTLHVESSLGHGSRFILSIMQD